MADGINRKPYFEDKLQSAFRYVEDKRKAYLYDGVGDYSAVTKARDTIVTDLFDANGSITVRAKVRFASITGTKAFFAITGTVGESSNYNQMSFTLTAVSGSNYRPQMVTKRVTTGIITVAAGSETFTPSVGQVVDTVINCDYSGAGVVCGMWVNGTAQSGAALTNTNALTLSEMTDGDYDINSSRTKASATGLYVYSGINIIDLKVFKGVLTPSQCDAATPELHYKFNGYDLVGVNHGSLGTDYNQALTLNSAATSFFTLVKE